MSDVEHQLMKEIEQWKARYRDLRMAVLEYHLDHHDVNCPAEHCMMAFKGAEWV